MSKRIIKGRGAVSRAPGFIGRDHPGYFNPKIGQKIKGRGPGSGSPKGAILGTKPGPFIAYPAPSGNVWHSGPPK